MNAADEFRVLLGVIVTIGAVGTVSGVVGIADHMAAAGLAAAVLGWVTALVIRREVRIRARLADPPHPTGIPPAGCGAVFAGGAG